MADFHLIKSSVVPLTRELAAQFRDLEPSPTERELSPARLKHLEQKATAGHLVTFNWARAKIGDKVMRMNGQHSSTMLCGLNGDFPAGLFAHIDDYQVDDREGLALLFRQFDDRKSGRSGGDVAGAYQMLEPALRGIPRPMAKLSIEGVAWYLRTVEGAPVENGDDLYRLFHSAGYHPFLLWAQSIFSIKTPELKRVPIAGAMYATWQKSEDEAGKFWTQVARGGVEFEDNAPSTVLDNWLKAAREGETKESLKPAQYYQGCVYAWNAHRESKTIDAIRADTRKSWYQPKA